MLSHRQVQSKPVCDFQLVCISIVFEGLFKYEIGSNIQVLPNDNDTLIGVCTKIYCFMERSF